MLGTTTFWSIKGCLASIKSIIPLSFTSGHIQFNSLAYLAFANIKSNSHIILPLFSITSMLPAIFKVSSLRILFISAFSLFLSSLISLLRSTSPIGSINNVAPVPLWSWIKPLTCSLYSDLTGSTYLSPLTV